MMRSRMIFGLLLLCFVAGVIRFWLPKPGGPKAVSETVSRTTAQQPRPKMPPPEIASFNSFGGTLKIELSIPPKQVAPHLLNQKSDPAAKIVSVKLVPQLYEEVKGEFRPLTEAELQAVAFRGPEIRLRGESERVVAHKAPNGQFFTVRELFLAIEETERQTRGESEWLGGIDVHHIFFEGIGEDTDGVWFIRWGS